MPNNRMTNEEINARIEAINTRLDAIDVMLDDENAELTLADGTAATVEQLETEYDTLTAELEQLEADKQANAAEERRAQNRAQRRAAMANAGTHGAPAVHIRTGKASESFMRNKTTSISGAETRSVLVSSGMIATPTGAQNTINDGLNVVSSIVDQVQVEDLTGMGEYKIPYEKAIPEAAVKIEGEKAPESDPEFRTSSIKPTSISVVSYISREVAKQSLAIYEQKVRDCALKALKRKAAHIILHGAAAGNGIYNALNTKEEAICDTLDMSAAIGADTLRKIVFNYGGDEDIVGGCRLYLSKRDLVAFGDIRGKNELKPIYEIIPDGKNPNTGIIKDGGLIVPYTICGAATSYTDTAATAEGVNTMIYGDPLKFTLGLFGTYEVEVSKDYKFAEGLLSVMGNVTLGGNVNADKGFLIVKKKTA